MYGVCPLCDGHASWSDEDESMAELSASIIERLRRNESETVEGMDTSLHYLPPHVPKVVWTALGDLVSAREKSSAGVVDGNRWISLRLDGSGFSRAVRTMRNQGILQESGFSDVFASCMQSCLRVLMEHFKSRVGYTQSDEMIVFIQPASVIRGVQQVHLRGGRVTKLTTLAASFATAHFVLELAKHCQESGLGLGDLCNILPHFDCRLGHYGSWEEARSLLLWRAYDCSVNGVSDAVYQIKGSGKQVQGADKKTKVEWLWKQGRLPLPQHQAYGTVLVKVRRIHEGYNPKLCVAVQTLRGAIEPRAGPVLERFRAGDLLPEDEGGDEDAAAGPAAAAAAAAA